MGRRRMAWAMVALALGLWTLGFFAGLMETPWRAIDDDENATIVHAELLAAGLPVKEAEFQLLPSCGGCRVLTLSAWALFSVFPPVVLTWKVLPLLFGLLAVGGSGLAGWRLAGPTAGGLAALLTALPPPVFRALGERAWGNHFEVAALVVLAVAATRHGRTMRGGAVLGLASALAVTFAYTAAPMVLVLLVGAWMTGARRGALLGGLVVGGLPWVGLRLAGMEAWFTIYGQGPSDWRPGPWLASLGSGWATSMWQPGELPAAVAWVGWAAFLAVPVVLVGVEARRREWTPELALGAAILSHLAAFVLVSPRLPGHPPAVGEPFSWRYLGPLFPVIGVGAAVLWSRGRWVLRAPAVVLLALGLVSLGQGVGRSQFESRSLHLPAPHVRPAAFTGRVGADPRGPITFDFTRPLARRQILWEAGLEAGRLLGSGHELHAGWWPWVEERPDPERVTLLLGLAVGLEERLGLGRGPESVEAFREAVQTRLPAGLHEDAARARGWARWGFTIETNRPRPAWLGSWRDGFEDALGGRQPSGDDAEYARGFGEGVGMLRGDERAAADALEALPAAHRGVAEEGFRRAREWAFPF